MENVKEIVKQEGVAALDGSDVYDENVILEQEKVVVDLTDDTVSDVMPVMTPPCPQSESMDIMSMLQIMMIKFDEQNANFKTEISGLNNKFDEQNANFKTEISGLNSKFDEQRSEVKAEINGLKEELKLDFQAKLDDRFNKWEDELNQKLAGLDIKFTSHKLEIDEKFEKNNDILKNKFQQQEQKLDSIVASETRIQSQITDCKGDIENINHKVEIIEEKVEKSNVKLNSDNNSLKREIDDIHVSNNSSETIVKTMIDQTVEDMREQLKKDIVDLQTKIDCTSQNGAVHAIPVAFPPDLHFAGKRGENPCLFLKRVDTYFELARPVPEAMKPKYIQQLLRGSASEWMLTLSEFPQSLADFRVKFLERYWNQTHRFKFEREQLDDRWSERSNLSMTEYAIKKIASFKMCDTQIPTQQLLWVISTHFPERIQNLLNSVEIDGVDRFLELLTRYDRVREFNSGGQQNKSKMDDHNKNGVQNNNEQRWSGNHGQFNRPYQNDRDRRDREQNRYPGNHDGPRFAPYRRGNGGTGYHNSDYNKYNPPPCRENDGKHPFPPPENPCDGNNIDGRNIQTKNETR